jgi:hypothetical protein
MVASNAFQLPQILVVFWFFSRSDSCFFLSFTSWKTLWVFPSSHTTKFGADLLPLDTQKGNIRKVCQNKSLQISLGNFYKIEDCFRLNSFPDSGTGKNQGFQQKAERASYFHCRLVRNWVRNIICLVHHNLRLLPCLPELEKYFSSVSRKGNKTTRTVQESYKNCTRILQELYKNLIRTVHEFKI